MRLNDLGPDWMKRGLRCVVAIVASVFAVVGQSPASTPRTTPPEFVDALNSAFGKQTTQRATHAKGVVLLGRFTPAATAAGISKAVHFSKTVPVTVRFSDNTGIPAISDKAGPARAGDPVPAPGRHRDGSRDPFVQRVPGEERGGHENIFDGGRGECGGPGTDPGAEVHRGPPGR